MIPETAWCWWCGQGWHKFHSLIYSWKCQPVVGPKPDWWRFGWGHTEPADWSDHYFRSDGVMFILPTPKFD